MKKCSLLFLLGTLCAIFLVYGCSGASSPVVPDSKTPTGSVGSVDTLPVIGATVSENMFNATGLFGAYELRLAPENQTAELVSKRLPSLGESWIVSGIGFFTIAPCSSCLKIQSIELTADNYLKLNFAISHPFDPGVTSLPPTARNRLDLDVFDLAMVLVPMGATATNYPNTVADVYSGFLVMNAGYTTELAGVIGDDAAMPYALVIDDSVSGTSTWNEFPMGKDDDCDLYFDFNSPTFVVNFDLYLTMGYGASAQGKAQRLTPTYFNPEFNRKAAWKVEVIPPEGSDPPEMGNTWNDSDDTTPFDVTVRVWDWQQGVTTIANPPVNPGDIALASNVTSVSVEILGMNTTLQSATTATSGTGSPSDPLVYTIPIANENDLAAGEYLGLVKVNDSRDPNGIPPTGTIDFVIDAPDGVTLTNYEIPEFATYQTFVATVVLGSAPPTCVIVTIPDPPTIVQGDPIQLDGSTSTCVNPIVSYEWDLDYDGITFDVDATGATTSYSSCTPQTITIALRVTSDVPLDSICTVDVTVTEDDGPIDGWHTDVNINPSMSLFPSSNGSRWSRTYGDNIYVVLCYTLTPYMSYFIKSTDRGATWLPPVSIHTQGSTTGIGAVYTRPTIAVDKVSGDLWVALSSNNSPTSTVFQDIYVTRSIDQGTTWASLVKANANDPSNLIREHYPCIDVDDSASPTKIYVGYHDITTAGAYDIWVTRSDANNWTTTWNAVRIDDSAAGSLQSALAVNPVDHSIGVIWTDPLLWATGGLGNLLWDRSSDGGVTWGTDVIVYTMPGSTGTRYGPGEPSLAFNPTTGIAGASSREIDTNIGRNEKFFKATDINGSAWSASITIDTVAYTNNANWGGCLDCVDGHWAFVCNMWLGALYYTRFTESLDDGATWSIPLAVNELTYGRANASLAFDDCRSLDILWQDQRSGTYVFFDWGT